MVKKIIVTLLFCVLVYLIAWFTSLEHNPLEWEFLGRYVVSTLWGAAIIVCVIRIFDERRLR